MSPTDIPLEFLLVALYAETHYRFRYFFSALTKREPELIADAPFRVEPGVPVPVLLLAKDADRHPLRIIRVAVRVTQNGRDIRDHIIPVRKPDLDARWWWQIANVSVEGLEGWIDLDVRFEIDVGGTHRVYHNDNHRTSSRRPLRVYVSPTPLPKLRGMHLGDIHTHSDSTDDQVEFGVPLEAAVRLSGPLGISFFAATDHSYDLDDSVESYLRNDPTLPKWRRFHTRIDRLGKERKSVTVIRGEEVSCRNQAGRNVHLLRLGSRDFVAGSGDGAERWFRTRSEHSIPEVLEKGHDSLMFAAHPAEDVPFLQRVLLYRDSWPDRDVRLPKLHGVQFANGSHRGFERGLQQWISALLDGHRLIAVAGNDAHGNFNRFRQIGIPFVLLREADEHLFGRMRTAVLTGSNSESSVLRALAAGRCAITDGPVARLDARTSGRSVITMGGVTASRDLTFDITARSTAEFGEIDRVILWWGALGNRAEAHLASLAGDGFEFRDRLVWRFDRPSYVRLEVRTSGKGSYDGRSHWCFTNPIWIE